jgi:hypothetical protein
MDSAAAPSLVMDQTIERTRLEGENLTGMSRSDRYHGSGHEHAHNKRTKREQDFENLASPILNDNRPPLAMTSPGSTVLPFDLPAEHQSSHDYNVLNQKSGSSESAPVAVRASHGSQSFFYSNPDP